MANNNLHLSGPFWGYWHVSTDFNLTHYTFSREPVAPQYAFPDEKDEAATLFGTNTAYPSH